MLAYRIDLQPQFVGKFGLLNNLAEPLTRRHARISDFSECGQPKLHGCVHLQTKMPYLDDTKLTR
jgi:hypothetical protein